MMAGEEESKITRDPDESEDESDDDYVPSEHSASEEDDSGDEEEAPLAADDKKSAELTQVSEVQQKKEKSRSDALWASFMADVDPVKKPASITQKPAGGTTNSNSKSTASSKMPTSVSTTVSSTSKTLSATNDSSSSSQASAPRPDTDVAKKRPGGLSSVLGFINKKQKVSTLDKSHLDWQKYKKEQGLNEELSQHNRSKNSYLEKQDFLQRTDQRRFEQERHVRLAQSAKRKKL